MKIRSVNLGGWFVLERWMKESLFENNNVEGNDETCFSNQSPNKEKALNEHYKTWITKDDILWLKEKGVNLVRIPIPWWLFGEDVYHRSVEKIDQALQMIGEVGIDFMLDLHTAPGCQNGFDNGGIQGTLEWDKDPKNIDKTIDVLEKITKHYLDYPHFHSIQLLNEPFVTIELRIIQDFYKRSYDRLRKITDKYIVMHDGFRLEDWEEFFTSNNFEKVILDTHMYQCFDHHMHPFTVEEHVNEALKRKERIRKIEEYVPVIVGEWSLGLHPNKHIKEDENYALKQYASAQLEAMNECTGHTFWSYKVEKGRSGWHFKNLVDQGIIDIEEFLK